MSKYVTTCSTNTVKGNDVDVRIKVSSPDGKFDLVGTIEIYGLSKIIDGKITAKFKKNSSSPSEFKYNNNEGYYYYEIKQQFSQLFKALPSFDIIITGNKNPAFQKSEHLRAVIPVVGGDAETINFEVFAEEKSISIQEFKAKNSIIQKGRNTLELNYEIKGEDEGVELTLFENAQKCNGNIQQSPIKIEFDNSKLTGQLYEYTLQATKGKLMDSKSVTIIYVEESTIKSRFIPNKTIINFCTAQNEDYLFALLSDKNKDIFELGFTDQIDGDNTWSIISIANQEALKSFANSPMLHLQSDNERNEGKLGRILLIGGSMIRKEHEDDANKVAIIDLDLEKNYCSIHETLPEGSFFHSCVLDNTNTIWLLGGQNEYGEVSNKIWTSVDGINWEKENDAPWPARCMASASVSWKYEGNKRIKEAIWLAGGFERYESAGTVIPDVWKYQNNAWTKINVNNLESKISDSKALALAYGGVEETAHTGLYLLGNTKENNYFFRLKKNSPDEYNLLDPHERKFKYSHHNQGTYITAFFRECLWVMGLYDRGSSGDNYSDLYYRIPTVHEETIKK